MPKLEEDHLMNFDASVIRAPYVNLLWTKFDFLLPCADFQMSLLREWRLHCELSFMKNSLHMSYFALLPQTQEDMPLWKQQALHMGGWEGGQKYQHRKRGFEPHLYDLLALWPWAKYVSYG